MENFEQTNPSAGTVVNEPVKENFNKPDTDTMTLGNWMLTIFITYIPVVGFVMLLIWAFGKGENENKKNWAKANLIWMVIGAILLIMSASLIMSSISSAFRA